MCPSCKKELNNNVIMYCACHHPNTISLILCFLLVMKPCGHVTCKTCTDSLVHPSKQCIVCDKKLAEKDILELKREGTTIIFAPTGVFVLMCDLRRHRICRWWYGGDIQEKYCFPGMIYSASLPALCMYTWCLPAYRRIVRTAVLLPPRRLLVLTSAD